MCAQLAESHDVIGMQHGRAQLSCTSNSPLRVEKPPMVAHVTELIPQLKVKRICAMHGCLLHRPFFAVDQTAACRQAGGVEGIVNGMDTTDWSPNVDKFLDVKYDADTVDEGKALAKETLQAELGLPVSNSTHTHDLGFGWTLHKSLETSRFLGEPHKGGLVY